MVSCDVTNKKSDYGVESYDYTIKYRLDDNYLQSKKVFTNDKEYDYDRTSNKRRHTDRSNVKLRLGKRVNSNQEFDGKQKPRFLPDLSATPLDPVEMVANELAEKLYEEKKELVGKKCDDFNFLKGRVMLLAFTNSVLWSVNNQVFVINRLKV